MHRSPCAPVIFLCVVFIVDYNPVFAKKSLNSLSVPLKRYIANIRSHKKGEQGWAAKVLCFMPYHVHNTQMQLFKSLLFPRVKYSKSSKHWPPTLAVFYFPLLPTPTNLCQFGAPQSSTLSSKPDSLTNS